MVRIIYFFIFYFPSKFPLMMETDTQNNCYLYFPLNWIESWCNAIVHHEIKKMTKEKKIFVSFRDSKRRRKWKLTVGSNSKNVRNLARKKTRMDRKPVEQLWQLKGRFLSSPTTPLWPIMLKYNPKIISNWQFREN